MILPLAATNIAATLLDLFIVLLAAKIGDELFKRIRQPSVVGEILAGVVIGPAVIDIVQPDATLEVFAELGVVFLLFWVGLETKISDIREVGRAAALVGVLGVIFPFAGGLGTGFALGKDVDTTVFLAAALVATSVGITSAVLIELGALTTRPSTAILGAAVLDDILAMLLVAVAAGIAGGAVDVGGILVTIALAVAFVAFFALGGTRLMRAKPQILEKPRFSASPLLPAVILCLGLAALAAEIGLAAVIGAFLAGMMVAETKERTPIEQEMGPLYAFFPPFFFVFIGLQIDLGTLVEGGTLALLAGITVLAIATKFVGAWLGARSLGSREATFVGIGMVPRGEVGIIIAGIGEAAGVLDEQLFAVIVGVSILTTLIAPPFLRRFNPTPRPSAVETS